MSELESRPPTRALARGKITLLIGWHPVDDAEGEDTEEVVRPMTAIAAEIEMVVEQIPHVAYATIKSVERF